MTGRVRKRGSAGGETLKRLDAGDCPAPSVVSALFGTWAAARAQASRHRSGVPAGGDSAPEARFGAEPLAV